MLMFLTSLSSSTDANTTGIKKVDVSKLNGYDLGLSYLVINIHGVNTSTTFKIFAIWLTSYYLYLDLLLAYEYIFVN